jgi:hypothetical protein
MVPVEVGGKGKPNTALIISQAEQSQLRSIASSRRPPHSLLRRAQIALLSADVAAKREVVSSCGVRTRWTT